jgi:hypothetical protein
MKIAIFVLAAYLLTGAHYVWRDLREPDWNRPSYARNGTGSLLFMVAYWLPGTIFSTYMRGPIKRHVVSWCLFAALIAAGLYFVTARVV